MTDARIATIIEQLERIAAGELTHRGQPSDQLDDIDAITVGLNMLADDLLRQQEHGRRATTLLQDMADLFEHAPVMLCSIHLGSGSIRQANHTLVTRHGPGNQEVIGAPLRDFVSRDSAPVFDAALRSLGARKSVHGIEIELRAHDGTSYAALLSAEPVVEAGTVTRARCTIVDIEHRLRLERELLEAQKLESIGRLAGGVAHDFNNLLTVISNHAEFVLEVLPEQPTWAEARADVQTVLEASARAAELTGQLLAFSRRQIARPHVLQINDVVQQAHRMLVRLLGETIDVVLLLAPDCGLARIDPGHLGQIVMNLAVNARDAMPGRGKLTIETANMTLDEQYARAHTDVTPGEYVMLAVSDDGVGMTEDVKLHVFEPFYTTKGKGKGTGLGLATCYGIVKQAGGHIWIYSEPGRGTTFKILLPRVEHGHATPLEAAREHVDPPGGTETILLSEDDERVRLLAARILADAGYEVLSVSSGTEAVRTFRARARDVALLLTDVVLPDQSGREIAEQLLALEPTLPILYFSGYTDNAIAHHGVLEPGVEFLAKPFRPAELLERVRACLDRPRTD